MLKPLSAPLMALALLAPLPVLAQQDDAATKKQLEDARADLERAAKRLAELSRGAGDLRVPISIDPRIVSRPRLGVLLSGDDAAGVRITGVTPESGAAKAGLKAGDRLLRVAGEPVRGDTADARVAHARELLTDLKVDTAVRVTYQRDGKAHEASVTPTQVSPRIAFSSDGPRSVFFHSGDGGMPQIEGVPVPLDQIASVISPDVQRELRQLGRLGECKGEECRLPALAEAFRWSNLNLATVDASLGRYFGTDAGVLVLSVGDELAGLQAGDVIRKVDGAPVTTPRDVTQALRGKPEDAKVAVEYLRDRQTRTSTVSVPKASAFRFPATSRITVKPRVAVGVGEAPTVVEKRRVMIVTPDGKVQTFDDNSDAPPIAPPARPAGKGGALL
ncbi:PDZ domain-containing protein [Pseudoxanthomonas sp. LH2527]|uniref:PDZ domain-containing protein n=1 Tax=Pseudoxanthomonas sp. LH2527 TaxID=2923249 RepID=UPI001F14114D|nr:PDZ domain-containing protein [Pseudoxanthomonas sp. LH2527]MCH6482287.1 PDZ domain-containing protein [Pseudoxanthomonas sp. LH2527]